MKNLKLIFSVALSVVVLSGIFFSLNPAYSESGDFNNLSAATEQMDLKVENSKNKSILVKSYDKTGNLNWEKEIIYMNNNTAKNVSIDNGDVEVEFTSSDLTGKLVTGKISYSATGDLKNISIY